MESNIRSVGSSCQICGGQKLGQPRIYPTQHACHCSSHVGNFKFEVAKEQDSLRTAWECPRCHVMNSPYVNQCDNCSER